MRSQKWPDPASSPHGGALGGGLLWALTDTRNGGEQKTVHWPPEHPVSPKPAPHKGSLCEVPWNVPW